ncbi:MAG TPA: electron transporter RnfB [Firmicutes bacterium]|nr:electron transporter RnfB [Bacillota bacterium]
MQIVINSIAILAFLGVVFGSGLAVASRKLKVESDPRIDEVEALLPGANCGGCGYPGCRGLAEAIVSGAAPVTACPVTKDYSSIAEVMGVEATSAAERMIAKVRCAGGKKEAQQRFIYLGVEDCSAAQNLGGGAKACAYGCLGLGNCAKVCPFEAITMSDNGLPIVDEEKCTGCGLCVKACPRHLITLWPVDKSVTVLCMNQDKGVEVRKVCKVGCIGCRICEKQCPTQAITVENNLARIDPQLCTECGICVTKCPMKTIKGEKKQEREVV